MRLLAKALRGRVATPAASLRLLVLMLATAFCVEVLLMFLLSTLLPKGVPGVIVAVIDATILTGILAPVVWRIFVVPIESLNESRRQLIQQMLTLQEDERSRISHDLHDGLGQNLTSIQMRLRVIEQTTTDEAIRENATTTRQLAAETLADVRRMVRDTRPPVLDELGLAAAIERRLADIQGASGIEANLEWEGEATRLPRRMETVLYRVIQEALANVIVHSGADRVTVELAILPAEVTARVTDNGHGFDVAKTLAGDRQPFGLLGIRERVASVSGSVNITSDARRGTVIEVRIPNPKEGPAPKEATQNGR